MSDVKKIHFYLDSEWDFKPPVIRIWLDDLLISERAVSPKKQNGLYLDEVISLTLAPGKYKLVIENIKTALADVQLHSIIMDNVHIPFKTSDEVVYEATLEI